MRSVDLRPETPNDHQPIYAVHASSFPTPDEARLVDALRDAGHLTASWVAVATPGVVGHVAFSPVTLAGASGGVGLGPVAVLLEFRQRGVADRLVREGLADCRRRGHTFVVVLGDPAYYHRFGFKPASDWGLRCVYEGGDAFQALELQPGAIPSGGGLVEYAPEFGGLSACQ